MIIAIEGIDGSGKGTQSRLLVDALRETGREVEFFQFPRYEDTRFGREVGRYLNGEYGALDQVHPKFAAMLYALDRFESVSALKAAISAGRLVVCDRYVGSNLAHQSARVPLEKQAELQAWIRDLEYTVLGIPSPDIVFFLDMPPHRARALIASKDTRSYTDKGEDLHEASGDHLRLALDVFRHLASENAWRRIECADADGTVKPPRVVHETIMTALRQSFDA